MFLLHVMGPTAHLNCMWWRTYFRGRPAHQLKVDKKQERSAQWAYSGETHMLGAVMNPREKRKHNAKCDRAHRSRQGKTKSKHRVAC